MSDMLFIAGQLAQDSSGNVIAPNNPAKQAEYIFGYIEKLLNDAGMIFDNLVKLSIFTNNMDYFQKISAVRDSYCMKSKPACTTIEIDHFKKEGCCVEIEAIAAKIAQT